MILLRASIPNFERLDILRDSFGHPSKKLLSFDFSQSFRYQIRACDILQDSFGHPSKNLLSFDFAQSFCSEFRASRYTTGHNQTSE